MAHLSGGDDGPSPPLQKEAFDKGPVAFYPSPRPGVIEEEDEEDEEGDYDGEDKANEQQQQQQPQTPPLSPSRIIKAGSGPFSPLRARLSSFRRSLSSGSSSSAATPTSEPPPEFSRDLSLQVSLVTIDKLQGQLVHSNKTVESLAAEVVALKRDLARGRSSSVAAAAAATATAPAPVAAPTPAPQPSQRQQAHVSYRRLHVGHPAAHHHQHHQHPQQHPQQLRHKVAAAAHRAAATAPSPSPPSPLAAAATGAAPVGAGRASQLQNTIEANTATLLAFMEQINSANSSSSGGGGGLGAPHAEQGRLVKELQAAIAGMGELRQQLQTVQEDYHRSLAGQEEACAHQAKELVRLRGECKALKAQGVRSERALLGEVKALQGECKQWREEAHERGLQVDAYRQELEAIKMASIRRRAGSTGRAQDQQQPPPQQQQPEGGGIGGRAVEGEGQGRGQGPAPPMLTAVDAIFLQSQQQQLEEEQARQQERAQRAIAGLRNKVEALELMLRTQMQIKSSVIGELQRKRDECVELRAHLGLPTVSVDQSLRVANAAKAKQLRETAALRKKASSTTTDTSPSPSRSHSKLQAQRSVRKPLARSAGSRLSASSAVPPSPSAFRLTSPSVLAMEHTIKSNDVFTTPSVTAAGGEGETIKL